MSSQRGNVNRTRPQKHKNKTAFKNNLHDTSPKIKMINSIQITNVCEKCKNILDWKIKYKKYKPLKAPRKCTKCEQKTVKHAYHMLCRPCAEKDNICPKCGKNEQVVKEVCSEEQFKLDAEIECVVKALPERKRRTFLRYINEGKHKGGGEGEITPEGRDKEDLMTKLQSLKVESSDDCLDSEFSESDFDDTEDVDS